MGAYDAGLVYSAARAQGRTMSPSDLAALCTTAGWVHNNGQAICIIMHESSGKTDARSKNPDGNENIGLFQIDTVNVLHGEHLLDPVYNANVAHRMWRADGGTFSKRWATASACAGITGNVQPGDEAEPVGIGGAAESVTNAAGNIGGAVQDAISGVLNGIPWFRLGKGAFGFVLLIAGTGAMVFVIGSKASKTPAGKAAIKLI
jgi:lysozyme-like protein